MNSRMLWLGGICLGMLCTLCSPLAGQGSKLRVDLQPFAAGESFSSVSSVVILDGGLVAVAEPLGWRVWVFEEDGQSHAVLRIPEGEGVRPFSFALRTQDTLVVVGGSDGRPVTTRVLGALETSVELTLARPRLEGLRSPGWLIAVLPEGRALWTTSGPSRLMAAGRIAEVPVVIVEPSGRVERTVYQQSVGHNVLRVQRPNGVTLVTTQPFGDDPLFAVDPLGRELVVVEREASTSGPIVVRRINVLSGDASAVEVAFSKSPFQQKWIQEWIKQRWPEALEDPVEEKAWMEAVFAPRYLPPVGEVVVGADGAVWLGLNDRPEGTRRRWMLLTREGGVIGEFSLPVALSIKAVAGGTAIGASHDPDGRRRLWRIEVSPVPSGPQGNGSRP